MESKDKRNALGKTKHKVIMPKPMPRAETPADYSAFLVQLKQQIKRHQVKALTAVNSEMIIMYWHIGQLILKQQQLQGWGAKVIDRLSFDLKNSFPSLTGFSPRNLKYMRKFAEYWPDVELVQRTVALIPWRSNLTLLDKLKTPELRLWYAQKTLELGLSKTMLELHITNRSYEREGKTINNFDKIIAPVDSDLVNHAFKDPYLFDFLGETALKNEKDLEQKLIDHIQHFLLELGQGFAFVGRQVHLEIGDSDFYADLLFYHLNLRSYVVVELKMGKFEPGHTGQLNLYTKAVDDLLRHADDKPTIGLLLVREKDQMVVEYSLSGYNQPIGVANWEQTLTNLLPDNLKSSLPSIEQIEAELADDIESGGVAIGKNAKKILAILKEQPNLTITELAELIAISTRAIEKNLKKLQDSQRLKRIGAKKDGFWEVLNDQ